MTVDEALTLLGCSKAELGRLLGIHRSAINQWGNNIPLAREYQIRDLTQGRNPLIKHNPSNQKSPNCANS